MNYDTINLLGLQPDLVWELNIIRIDDVININLTLKKLIMSVLNVAVFISS